MRIRVFWMTKPRVDVIWGMNGEQHFCIFQCPACGEWQRIHQGTLLPIVEGRISCINCFTKKYTRKGDIPIRVRNEHGRPVIYLGKEFQSWNYKIGFGRSIRNTLEKDNAPFKSMRFTNPEAFDDFLDRNDIDIEEIELNGRTTFYGFKYGGFSFNLTEAFVERWWGYDCPDIYRYSLGDYSMSNLFGQKLSIYYNNLVEWGINGCYLDGNITKEEILALTKGHENTTLYKEGMAFLERKELGEEKRKEIARWVYAYDQKVQKVIDEHRAEILAHTEGMEDAAYGFDCGFLNIFNKDEDYNDKRRLIGDIRLEGEGEDGRDIHFYKSMGVRLPRSVQSLTIQKKDFEKAREVVERELGIQLYCTTMLD